jgi:hypothetical protein
MDDVQMWCEPVATCSDVATTFLRLGAQFHLNHNSSIVYTVIAEDGIPLHSVECVDTLGNRILIKIDMYGKEDALMLDTSLITEVTLVQ